MRRPPGLWILLSAGVVWLSLQNAYGLRATSLIFGKTTTTTTTTAKPTSEEPADEETATTDLSNDPNSTKPTLTGNPQLDYIWDPNLPQELNGYNLSDYPFYERVPEDIDFKCDGLHDGFYASVAHKCQVYHHCLFGTRYDFLCANYTAFDQKTFICHFASEVDCPNSKKFWHRNDALYKSASTTTVKPFVIYTTAPPPMPPLAPIDPAPLPPTSPGSRRPVGGRRRPFRRRRPQYDYYDDEYYDDYYEERPRSNRGRKRPRPRPRPVYDDDYEEYEDDRYQRRGGGNRREEERRPYDRRSGNRRRNQDRVKEEYDEETDSRFEDEDLGARRKPSDRKRPEDSEEERYSGSRKRRPLPDRSEDYEKPLPRKGQRRPVKDDYEEDSPEEDDARSYERPRQNNDRRTKPRDDTRTIVKPVSGTIYDRPRVAPRIKLPVPKNEADKYAYKPADVQTTPAASQQQETEEYYDEYEEELAPARKNSKSQQSESRSRDRGETSRKQTTSSSRPRRPDTYEVEERPRSKTNRDRPKRPVAKDYYDDYEEEEEEKEVQRPSAVRNSEKRTRPSTSTTTTTTTTTIAPVEKVEQPVVRLVKRPFLPSRGGNPFAARGLQPVGTKAVGGRIPEKVLGEEDTIRKDEESHNVEPEAFKPLPPVVNSDDFRHQNFAGPRTTQKPKVPERNPLDINEEDYDVTLNDALNPTLPNVPVRGSPQGFNAGSEYSFASAQRNRYNLDPAASQTSSEYTYQAQPLRQAYQQPQRQQFVQSDAQFTGQYSSYRPRQVQQQTEVYHHCLFGTRYDFLCANFTAFDQTLFNCNFVSNVDCENSKKYWHRNDELYIEKSTTTVAPAINYNFYTPPPQVGPLTPSPGGVLPQEAPIPRRQAAPRPRATRPPARPLYDYYDDYEEVPRPKSRKRPRPRPRPVYYDDYEEYDDLRVGRRGGGRRRPYSRRDRPMRRNKDRRKFDYEDDDYVYEDDIVLDKKEKTKRRKLVDDYEYDEDDRRFEKRRTQPRRDNKPARKKLPIDEYDYEEDERFDRRKLKEERDRRPLNEENKKTPRLGKRRPPSQEYEDDLQQADDPQSYDRPRKINKSNTKPADDGRPMIKPVSGTIYDRPRVAPRINLPVPKNAADRFAYKPIGAPTTPAAKVEEEEYDDYEEVAPQAAPTEDKKPSSSRVSASKVKEEDSTRSKPKIADSEEKAVQDSAEDYEETPSKLENSASKSATTEQGAAHSPMPVIRKFKRPFLPSRGGNPYSPRNLQPVGTKAKNDAQEIDLGESSVMKSVADPDVKEDPEPKTPSVPKVTITTTAEESTLRSAVQEMAKEPKSGLIRIKVPIRMKPYPEQDDSRSPYSIPQPTTTTTEQTKLAKEDILNGNYDVTLNEAISPIIPNLPGRGFGGYNPATDYSYKRFQRPTKYVILDPVVSAGNTYYVR